MKREKILIKTSTIAEIFLLYYFWKGQNIKGPNMKVFLHSGSKQHRICCFELLGIFLVSPIGLLFCNATDQDDIDSLNIGAFVLT